MTTPPPPTVARIKVTKQFTYRGVTRHFSNTYCFKTGTPPDGTHWNALAAAIGLVEKTCYTSDVSIVQYDGYAPNSNVPVFTLIVSTPGTLAPSTSIPATGDSAVMVRYSTAARSTKNHPIFLWNYFHGARTPPTGGDTLYAAQVTAFANYAANWLSGFSDGTTTFVRCGPKSAVATGQLVGSTVRHRDLPN